MEILLKILTQFLAVSKATCLGSAIFISYITVMSDLQIALHPERFSEESKDALSKPLIFSVVLWSIFYFM